MKPIHQPPSHPIRHPALVLFAAAVLPYLSSLGNGFVWGDETNVLRNAALLGADNFREVLTSGQMAQRPLANLALALGYGAWGLEPWGYHLGNLLLHGANTLLLGLCLRRAFGPEPALAAGLLFALHPVHAESVNLVLDQAGILCALFYLSGLFFYLAMARSVGRRRAACYALFLLSFALSLLSKEMGATLPLVLLLYEALFDSSGGARPLSRRVAPLTLPLALLALFPLYLMAIYRWDPFPRYYWGGSLANTLLMMSTVVAEYVRLLVFPLELSIWYVTPIPPSPWAGPVLIGWGVVAALLLLALLACLRGARVVTFSVLWFFATLLPVSNLVPITGSMMAERWLYLPSVGFCLAAGAAFVAALRRCPSPGWRRGLILAFALLLGLYGGRIVLRNPELKDGYTAFQKLVRDLPGSYFAHSALGREYLNRGDLAAAEREYHTALEFSPIYNEALKGLGVIHFKRGDLAAAHRMFSKSLKANPADVETHNDLGTVYLERKDPARAVHHFRQALRHDKNYSPAHNGLGEVHLEAGRVDEAIAELIEAIRLDRLSPPPHWNMALALERKGRREEAGRYWKRFLELTEDPDDRREVEEHLKELRSGR